MKQATMIATLIANNVNQRNNFPFILIVRDLVNEELKDKEINADNERGIILSVLQFMNAAGMVNATDEGLVNIVNALIANKQ